MDDPLLVTSRGRPRRIERLRMECDVRDAPRSVEPGAGFGEWHAARATLTGRLRPYNDGEIAPAGAVSVVVGGCLLAVTTGRLLGILLPADTPSSSVWFAGKLADLDASLEDDARLLRRRARRLRVRHAAWELECAGLRGLLRSRTSRRGRCAATASLVAALAGDDART